MKLPFISRDLYSNYSRSEVVIGAGLLLLIVAFIPSIPLVPFKFALIALGAIAFLSFFLLESLKNKKMVFPLTPALLAALILPIAYLASALINGSSPHAFFGVINADSVLGMFVLFVVFLSFFLYYSGPKKLSPVIYGIIGGATLASFLQIAFILLARFDIFPVSFFSNVPTLVGEWNDLSLLASFALILFLSLSTLSKKNSEIVKWSGAACGILLLGLIVTNFLFAWKLVLGFSFIILIYSLSQNSEAGKRGQSALALITLVLALFSVLSGGLLGSTVQNAFDISYIEARPSLETMTDISDSVLRSSPVLGTGPGSFAHVWEQYKPLEVNLTPFWLNIFDRGSGYIPMILISGGILALGALILLLTSVSFEYVRNFNRKLTSSEDQLEVVLGIGTLFLIVTALFYSPGPLLIGLLFAFLGISSGIFLSSKSLFFSYSWKEGESNKFLPTFLLSLTFVGILVLGYVYVEAVASLAYHGRAISALQNGDLETAERFEISALRLNENPQSYEVLIAIYTNRLETIVNDGAMPEAEKAALAQQILTQLITSTEGATAYNQNNYQNWIVLARAYTTAQNLGIEGAGETALNALERAEALSPQSPLVALERARTLLSVQDVQNARTEIRKAFEFKPNYTEAALLLAQIELSQGNEQEAISLLEGAISTRPQDPTLYFQLGLLHYSTESYQEAARVFNQALELNPGFANARYFFGLSLYNLGQTNDSLAQFRLIEQSNPDNQELKLIISNLQRGLPPLEGAEPPLDVAPEAREDLPLEE